MSNEKVIVEIGAIDNASAKLNDVANKSESMGSRIGGALNNATAASLAFAAGLAAVAATLAAGIGYGIRVAADLETARQGFVTLLGSAEAADKTMARIKKEAASTPFEIPGLTKGVQLLTAVTKDGDKAIDIILDVGEGLAAMGKGQAELDRIIINLQQIANVGKVSELDIKQFGFAGINILELLADHYGTTETAAMEMIKNSSDAFGDLIAAFDEANDAGGDFFNAYINQAGTFNQLWSNAKDIFGIFLAELVTSTGIFDAVKNVLASFIGVLTEHKQVIIDSVMWLKEHEWVIAIVAGAIVGALVPAFYFLATAVWAATAPLIPFMAIGAALAALSYLIYTAWQTNFLGFQEVVTLVVDFIALHIGIFMDTLKMIFEVTLAILQGNWQGAWQAMENWVMSIVNRISAWVDKLMEKLRILGEYLRGIQDRFNQTSGGISGAFSVNARPMADGGIVTRPTFAMIGEAGPEAVIPLRNNRAGVGAGGVTINIENNSFFGDDERFVEKIGDKLLRLIEPHIAYS